MDNIKKKPRFLTEAKFDFVICFFSLFEKEHLLLCFLFF